MTRIPKPLGSSRVILNPAGVNRAIHFNGQTALDGKEIEDEFSHLVLPPELDALKALSAQKLP